MAANVKVSTDAKVSDIANNLGSKDKEWNLKDEKDVLRNVITRLNRDGSRAYLYLRSEPGRLLVPVVLATVDTDGVVTYGGSGRIFDQQQNKLTNSVVTTPQQGKDLLSGGLINGVGATIEDQLNLGDTKAKILAKTGNSNNPTANQNPFVVSTRKTPGAGPQTLTVVPFQGNAGAGGTVTESAVSPGNNQPGVGSTDGGSINLDSTIKFVIDKAKELN